VSGLLPGPQFSQYATSVVRENLRYVAGLRRCVPRVWTGARELPAQTPGSGAFASVPASSPVALKQSWPLLRPDRQPSCCCSMNPPLSGRCRARLLDVLTTCGEVTIVVPPPDLMEADAATASPSVQQGASRGLAAGRS